MNKLKQYSSRSYSFTLTLTILFLKQTTFLFKEKKKNHNEQKWNDKELRWILLEASQSFFDKQVGQWRQ